MSTDSVLAVPDQIVTPAPGSVGTPLRVLVIGQGYVGLPLAMRAVAAGHRVVGFDVNDERIKRLQGAESYIEDVSDAEVQAALDSGLFSASFQTRACAGFDIAVITVPTPLNEGNPDLSYIEASARTLARFLRPGATVVLESTTYPGTTTELVGPILENGSGLSAGIDFHLGYSPERIDPGNPHWTLANTPKVVSGATPEALERVKAFYDTITEQTVPVSSPAEAELAKLLENTFRHVNIALVNELAMFAHDLGIDVWEAIDAASSKPFGFMRFTPGPGVGGHCLPIDPSYLSWRVKRKVGQSFRFVELANDVNDHMPDYVLQRVILGLNKQGKAVSRAKVLLLGLSYKRNTGDARESPALRVAELLLSMGARVSAADPHIVEGRIDQRISRAEVTEAAVAEADAVVLLTDHDSFDFDMIGRKAKYVLDCRRRIEAPTAEWL